MTEQIHKRLVDEQVGTILERYLNKEIAAEQGMDLLGLKWRQFLRWVNTKDLFSLREKKTANAYRKVSFGKIEFKVPGVNPYDEVELHMIPNEQMSLTKIRFWHKGKLAEIQNIKSADLKRVHF